MGRRVDLSLTLSSSYPQYAISVLIIAEYTDQISPQAEFEPTTFRLTVQQINHHSVCQAHELHNINFSSPANWITQHENILRK